MLVHNMLPLNPNPPQPPRMAVQLASRTTADRRRFYGTGWSEKDKRAVARVCSGLRRQQEVLRLGERLRAVPPELRR